MDSRVTGAFICKLRKEQDMTQAALAERLNISNRTISKWENGDGFPDITIMPELAEVFGVTVDELLDGKRAEREIAEINVTEIENKDNLLNLFQISYILSLFFGILGAVLGVVTEIYSTWAFNILFYTHWEIIFVACAFLAIVVSTLSFAIGSTRLRVSYSDDEVRHIVAKKNCIIALFASTLPVAFIVRVVDCSRLARSMGLTPMSAFIGIMLFVALLFAYLWREAKKY